MKLHQSVRDYLVDPAIKTAVVHLLEQKTDEAVLEMEWGEVPAFHRALLGAQQVRAEWMLFYFDLWDSIWEPELLERFPQGLPRTLSPHEHEYGHPNYRALWHGDEFFHRFFYPFPELPSLLLDTAVQCFPDEGVRLAFCLWDEESDERSTALELPTPWAPLPEANWRMTLERLVMPSPDSLEIDVSPLREAAGAALDAAGLGERTRPPRRVL